MPHTTEMARLTHAVADLTVATMNYSIVLRCKDKRVAYATKSGKRMRSVTFLDVVGEEVVAKMSGSGALDLVEKGKVYLLQDYPIQRWQGL